MQCVAGSIMNSMGSAVKMEIATSRKRGGREVGTKEVEAGGRCRMR